MDSSGFKKKLLETKKDKAIEIALLVCEREHLPIPKINFKGCQQETQDHLAHYHPDLHKICISEIQLYKLKTLRDVENTMYHELAHIVEQNHGPGFVRAKNKFSLDTWRPPQGVMYVKGGQKIEIPKQEKEKIDKIRCNYHLCRKKRKLSKCPYCKRYFCKEHIKPIVPGKSNTDADHEMDYHPCSPYYNYDKKQKEIEHEKYREALDALKYRDYNFRFEDKQDVVKPKNEKFERDYQNFKKQIIEKQRNNTAKKMSKEEIEESRKKLGINITHVSRSKPKKKSLFDKLKGFFSHENS
ncbi:MAG: hypothetical protein KGI06_03090 [Candidatus Micrarchaeota archaeon]|nr:hypothetical protein [Candidatus Micrarchaeota archaeon]